MTRTALFWLIWIVGTIAVGGYLFAAMIYGGDRSSLLIGKTTSGHHQIELSCNSCHDNGFSNIDTIQKACLKCHEAELKVSNDSHPIKKFRDPRNADRLEKLNAMACVTCHREHKPELISAMGMGVTLPQNYCFKCHENIGEERPHTHQNLDFNSCASAGCHNYHDNRALYEKFLEKHAHEPDMKAEQLVANLHFERLSEDMGGLKRGAPLELAGADAPKAQINDSLLASWHGDAHAQNGVNCSGCHQRGEDKTAWIAKPGHAECATCHVFENKTFLEGKHGMRLKAGLVASSEDPFGFFKHKPLGPMKPELARLEMKEKAHGKSLTCNSCHSVGKNDHKFSIKEARVGACLSCHDDEHSRSYLGSPHHKLWQQEQAGVLPQGSGVTCATCHMPRIEMEDDYENKIFVITHNQNDTLRPNEKMIRPACLSCHGLRFSIDSLADPQLVQKNFNGRSKVLIKSIDWALIRSSKKEGEK